MRTHKNFAQVAETLMDSSTKGIRNRRQYGEIEPQVDADDHGLEDSRTKGAKAAKKSESVEILHVPVPLR